MSRMTSSSKYDYIITGMGCAGLSLAVHMIHSGDFADKKILLIDRERKDRNDRTWCFWETGEGPFEDVVYRKWERAWFHAEGFSKLLDLAPYAYKMIRGIDYYNHCLSIISEHPNFEICHADVERFDQEEGKALVVADGHTYTADYIFNSIFLKPLSSGNGSYHHLLQHFKGWIIETKEPVFDAGVATLMDFRPVQDNGTTFVYVMPFSPNTALVEYTLFSPELLHDRQYKKGLDDHIRERLGITEYSVRDEEFGIIPMTNHPFRTVEGRIINLGTAGGQTKASSGFTFRFIQQNSARIIASFKKHGHPLDLHVPGKKRFDWYDSVLLNILQRKKLEGWYVFRELFRHNRPSTILKFLDNETTLMEELRLMSTLPQWPFMKAGFAELTGL
jgi:lycopene beta-cyclase